MRLVSGEIIKVGSLPEYIQAILHLRSSLQLKTLFFRGVANSAYQCQPSVFRADYPEAELTHNFRAAAGIERHAPDAKDLDRWLFLMQHHGLPTRLLDWTESSIVALFFATTQTRDQAPDSDACVYILKPTVLNEMVLGERWFPDRKDPNYLFRFQRAFYRNPFKIPWNKELAADELGDMTLPLAVKPVYTHPRMISQKSCFTIHGTDKRSIEQQLADRKGNFLLTKIILDKDFVATISRELGLVGITQSMIFPDLDGLAREISERPRPLP